jgi:hypothetical protein
MDALSIACFMDALWMLYGIDRRTEQQVLQRIESLTETVLKNQAETRSELQSLHE